MKGPSSSWSAVTVFLVGLLAAIFTLHQISNPRVGQPSTRNNQSDEHSRQKRFMFMSSDRILGFPPKTSLSLSFTFSVPAIRNLPAGYSAVLTLSTDFAISFDQLGFTSAENPWFFFAFYDFTQNSNHEANRAGGDRQSMFETVEGMLEAVGMEGKPCLLRAICEIFEVPLKNHGFIGEVLELLLSVSLSPHAENRLGDYIEAERAGKRHGNCSYYTNACLHSLFATTVTEQPKLIPVPQGSRQKRFLYWTRERRLNVPPGSIFILAPVISTPFRGYTPIGLGLPNFAITVPFEVFFDDLGLTTEEHPWGIIEGLDEISSRKSKVTRGRRSEPKIPGGDREMIYRILEDTLRKTRLNGKACLLRAICEMFQCPLENHGLLGEFLELLFSASKAFDADKRLPEYTAAERSGRTTGNCSAYHQACPYSLFKNANQDFLDGKAKTSDAKMKSTYQRKSSLFDTSNIISVLFEYLESWL